jgi:flavorubredoxin
MFIREIKPKVYSIGAIDWDRRLFDELIPLPEGTSYNSYLLMCSNKTALVDTVDPTKESELLENLRRMGVEKIDYLISHHAEQDHSGAIPKVLELYPEAKLICMPKAKELLSELLSISEDRFMPVKDGDTVQVGHKHLEFMHAPWVHWPETMITYVKELKLLFSCDLFGSHLATSDLYATDEPRVYAAAKRYYAEIMMPFRKNIRNHLKRIADLDIDTIAPSHGPVHSRPRFILDAYEDWVSDEVKNEVVIAYVSMHGSTKKMVDHFVDGLMERGITVKLFDLPRTDIGELAMALVDTATLVVASPTVLTGPHPAAVYATYLANALRPKLKYAVVIGSYGWGGKIVDTIAGMLNHLKTEMLDPVVIKGFPQENDLKALDQLADLILGKHKEIGIAQDPG